MLTVGSGNGSGTFSGTIQNTTGTVSLVKIGAGSLWLTGANTYSGGTTLNGGTLAVTTVTGLGSGGAIAIGPATLEIAGVISSGRNISFTSSAATIQVDPSMSYSNNGTLSGTGGLTKTARASWPSPANNYSGGTRVAAGILQLGSNAALGANAGTLTVTGGLLDLNAFSPTVGASSGAGTIDDVTAGGAPVLTVGSGGASATFSGTIQNTTGTVSLVKTGAGSLWLTGANTYSGGTTLSNGTLAVTSVNGLGAIGARWPSARPPWKLRPLFPPAGTSA